jgi:predicted transcriptional regulator
MPRSSLPHISPAELAIMKILWRNGRLSAREIHDRLADRLGWAYSTTRTTVERMVRKGLVDKKLFHGLHVYEAGISRAAGLARMVRDFSDHVLEASHVPVVSLFAEAGTLNDDEIAELEELLAADGAGHALQHGSGSQGSTLVSRRLTERR